MGLKRVVCTVERVQEIQAVSVTVPESAGPQEIEEALIDAATKLWLNDPRTGTTLETYANGPRDVYTVEAG